MLHMVTQALAEENWLLQNDNANELNTGCPRHRNMLGFKTISHTLVGTAGFRAQFLEDNMQRFKTDSVTAQTQASGQSLTPKAQRSFDNS